jgi:uncharacterized OB-fold protein
MEERLKENRVPIIKGWLNMDMDDPHLIGNRCKSCGEYYFPKAWICRNPGCISKDLEEVFLSRRGKVWSYTLNCYPPPPPYVPMDKFVPYAIVVVDLPEEKLMVMGPLADGCEYEDLEIGMDMEMIFEALYRDDEGNEHIIWKWRPLKGADI